MKQTNIHPLRLPASLKAAVAAISPAEFFAARSDEADVEAALRILRREAGCLPIRTMRSPRNPLDRERAGLPFCTGQEVPDDPVTPPPP